MIGILDKNIFVFLNNLTSESVFFDSLIIFLATSFGTILTIGVFLFLIFHRDQEGSQYTFEKIKRKIGEASVILFSAFLSWLFVLILKDIFDSPRPFITYTEIKPLFDYGEYDSFPSGHATFFAALGVALFMYHKRIGIFYLFGALIIGLSRIIAGVHFPFDIVAGFILGSFTSFFVYRALRPKVKRILNW